MSVHLDRLEFSICREPVKPPPPKVLTLLIFEAPVGFRDAVRRHGADVYNAIERLRMVLSQGGDSWDAKVIGSQLKRVQAEWHPFIRTERSQLAPSDQDIETLRSAGDLLGLHPAVVLVGMVATFYNMNREEWFPRPCRQDRRRPAPENAIFFPGVKPWGNHRRREQQRA